MSYDYMLGKGEASMDMEGFMESAASGIIATQEILKTSITTLFPAVRWEQSANQSPHGSAQISWFGRAGRPGFPEFQFLPEPDGSVRLLFMRRCERSEVELVARSLKLAALDEQTMEVFGA